MTSQQPAPGWYPDPTGGPGQRYWGGAQWQAPPPPPAPMPPPYGGVRYELDAYGQPLSDKSRLVAGLLQLFLGGLGIGRFYLATRISASSRLWLPSSPAESAQYGG